MPSDWPEEISSFERFLQGAGLELRLRDQHRPFGDKELRYANAVISAHAISDRCTWFIEIGDANAIWEWYDVAILRDLIVGSGDDVLPIEFQIEFVKQHWVAILEAFSPTRRQSTHARLAILRRERSRRRFPHLFD